MFKPTQPLAKRMTARLRLTTKQVNGGYYKGNRTGSMGRHTDKGGYVVDFKKVRTYVVPEGLEDFKLTPFVTRRFEPEKSIAQTPTQFLSSWRAENQEEVKKLDDYNINPGPQPTV